MATSRCAIVAVVDCSSSMEHEFKLIMKSLEDALGSSGGGDDIFLVTFNHHVKEHRSVRECTATASGGTDVSKAFSHIIGLVNSKLEKYEFVKILFVSDGDDTSFVNTTPLQGGTMNFTDKTVLFTALQVGTYCAWGAIAEYAKECMDNGDGSNLYFFKVNRLINNGVRGDPSVLSGEYKIAMDLLIGAGRLETPLGEMLIAPNSTVGELKKAALRHSTKTMRGMLKKTEGMSVDTARAEIVKITDYLGEISGFTGNKALKLAVGEALKIWARVRAHVDNTGAHPSSASDLEKAAWVDEISNVFTDRVMVGLARGYYKSNAYDSLKELRDNPKFLPELGKFAEYLKKESEAEANGVECFVTGKSDEKFFEAVVDVVTRREKSHEHGEGIGSLITELDPICLRCHIQNPKQAVMDAWRVRLGPLPWEGGSISAGFLKHTALKFRSEASETNKQRDGIPFTSSALLFSSAFYNYMAANVMFGGKGDVLIPDLPKAIIAATVESCLKHRKYLTPDALRCVQLCESAFGEEGCRKDARWVEYVKKMDGDGFNDILTTVNRDKHWLTTPDVSKAYLALTISMCKRDFTEKELRDRYDGFLAYHFSRMEPRYLRLGVTMNVDRVSLPEDVQKFIMGIMRGCYTKDEASNQCKVWTNDEVMERVLSENLVTGLAHVKEVCDANSKEYRVFNSFGTNPTTIQQVFHGLSMHFFKAPFANDPWVALFSVIITESKRGRDGGVTAKDVLLSRDTAGGGGNPESVVDSLITLIQNNPVAMKEFTRINCNVVRDAVQRFVDKTWETSMLHTHRGPALRFESAVLSEYILKHEGTPLEGVVLGKNGIPINACSNPGCKFFMHPVCYTPKDGVVRNLDSRVAVHLRGVTIPGFHRNSIELMGVDEPFGIMQEIRRGRGCKDARSLKISVGEVIVKASRFYAESELWGYIEDAQKTTSYETLEALMEEKKKHQRA